MVLDIKSPVPNDRVFIVKGETAISLVVLEGENLKCLLCGNMALPVYPFRKGEIGDKCFFVKEKNFAVIVKRVTVFEKIYDIISENSKIAYSTEISEFGSLPGSSKWNGGVLAPNGKIYGIPYDSTTVLEIDPETKSTSTFGSVSGSGKWNGGVLAPNGKIYGIPRESETVLEIDPEAQTATTFGNVEISSSGIAYIGGVLAPNGKIYAIPYNAGTILKIDPELIRHLRAFQRLELFPDWKNGLEAFLRPTEKSTAFHMKVRLFWRLIRRPIQFRHSAAFPDHQNGMVAFLLQTEKSMAFHELHQASLRLIRLQERLQRSEIFL